MDNERYKVKHVFFSAAEEAALFMASLITDPIPDIEIATLKFEAAKKILEVLDMEGRNG